MVKQERKVSFPGKINFYLRKKKKEKNNTALKFASKRIKQLAI